MYLYQKSTDHKVNSYDDRRTSGLCTPGPLYYMVHNGYTVLDITLIIAGSQMIILDYCRSGNIRENLIFANIRELVASRIQSSR